MLNAIAGLGPDVVAFDATGVVTADDYAKQLVPAVERVLEAGHRPRFLYVLGPSFERFEVGAILADARVGVSHAADFERVAVVTDHDWLTKSVHALGVLIPCPVRRFGYGELGEAKAWITEERGDDLLLTVERSGKVARIHARVRGALDRAAEDRLVHAAKEGIGDATEVRVLLEAEDFHGWRDLRALWQHVRFVAGMRAKLDRVAIVGDAKWQRRMVGTAKHVLRVDARFFGAGELAAARAWLDA